LKVQKYFHNIDVQKQHNLILENLMMLRNKIINLNNLSDHALVQEIGKKFKKMRLNKNITQDELAKISGLDRTTISQLENGRPATLLTFVQVLRALDKLELLNIFSDEPDISPLEAVKLKRQTRKRASKKKNNDKNEEASEW
jgi:transcriptional regulator with XRE-family HTH domain